MVSCRGNELVFYILYSETPYTRNIVKRVSNNYFSLFSPQFETWCSVVSCIHVSQSIKSNDFYEFLISPKQLLLTSFSLRFDSRATKFSQND